MNLKSVMTPKPACCIPQTALRGIAHLMKERDCGLIPVVDTLDTLRPIGTITDRDIAMRIVATGKDPAEATAADCMTSPCVTIEVDRSLRDCCELMEAHMLRRMLVVDDDGKLCGIVSLADVAHSGHDATTVDVLKVVSQPA
ncbi:MAG TPA: CBS domain-containing protein [Xanthomonadaceae bacterium]|jgi:CBS domain-containing protein|nr:CBS domain-containing protein [Xanthomonadaceae bacterium]